MKEGGIIGGRKVRLLETDYINLMSVHIIEGCTPLGWGVKALNI